MRGRRGWLWGCRQDSRDVVLCMRNQCVLFCAATQQIFNARETRVHVYLSGHVHAAEVMLPVAVSGSMSVKSMDGERVGGVGEWGGVRIYSTCQQLLPSSEFFFCATSLQTGGLTPTQNNFSDITTSFNVLTGFPGEGKRRGLQRPAAMWLSSLIMFPCAPTSHLLRAHTQETWRCAATRGRSPPQPSPRGGTATLRAREGRSASASSLSKVTRSWTSVCGALRTAPFCSRRALRLRRCRERRCAACDYNVPVWLDLE